MEGVPVHTAELDLLAVDVEAVAGPDLRRPEAEFLGDLVDGGPGPDQLRIHPVAVGEFVGPEQRVRKSGAQVRHAVRTDRRGERRAERLSVQGPDPGAHLGTVRAAAHEGVHREGAVRPGVDRHAADVERRADLQPDRPEDAAEHPEVRLALGVDDALVGGTLADVDFQHVVPPVPEGIGDVDPELAIAALVQFADRPAVEFDRGVGHRPAEDQGDLLAPPGGRDGEAVPVDSGLVQALGQRHMAVGELAEALELPVGGDGDLGPPAAAAARSAVEIPQDGVVAAGSAQIDLPGGDGRSRHGRQDQDQAQGDSNAGFHLFERYVTNIVKSWSSGLKIPVGHSGKFEIICYFRHLIKN